MKVREKVLLEKSIKKEKPLETKITSEHALSSGTLFPQEPLVNLLNSTNKKEQAAMNTMRTAASINESQSYLTTNRNITRNQQPYGLTSQTIF